MQVKVVEAVEIPNEKSRPQFLARLQTVYPVGIHMLCPGVLFYHNITSYSPTVTA
jgi:hypothetical protein